MIIARQVCSKVLHTITRIVAHISEAGSPPSDWYNRCGPGEYRDAISEVQTSCNAQLPTTKTRSFHYTLECDEATTRFLVPTVLDVGKQ